MKDGFESIQCPSGGQYTIARIGEPSSCSIHGALPTLQTPEELTAIQQQFNDRLEVLPLIQFEDAPLTDAIVALARQWGNFNLVFDPAVVPLLDSSITIRLEKLTAKAALEVILSTNNLRLVHPEATWKRAKDAKVWPGDLLGVTKK